MSILSSIGAKLWDDLENVGHDAVTDLVTFYQALIKDMDDVAAALTAFGQGIVTFFEWAGTILEFLFWITIIMVILGITIVVRRFINA